MQRSYITRSQWSSPRSLGATEANPRERRGRPSRTPEEPPKNFLFSALPSAGGVYGRLGDWDRRISVVLTVPSALGALEWLVRHTYLLHVRITVVRLYRQHDRSCRIFVVLTVPSALGAFEWLVRHTYLLHVRITSKTVPPARSELSNLRCADCTVSTSPAPTARCHNKEASTAAARL